MSTFTDDDRELITQTHTLLTSHIKASDERHGDYQKKFDDHEARLRSSEKFRNRVIGWAVGSGFITAAGAEALLTKMGWS